MKNLENFLRFRLLDAVLEQVGVTGLIAYQFRPHNIVILVRWEEKKDPL